MDDNVVDHDTRVSQLTAGLLIGAVVECARDHVAMWKAQKISGASRAERNATIEDSRLRLIAAVEALDAHQ